MYPKCSMSLVKESLHNSIGSSILGIIYEFAGALVDEPLSSYGVIPTQHVHR
jgi:hypothetical protein